jgi:hypothetical protein
MISRTQMQPLLLLYAYIVLITGVVSGLKGDDYSRLRGKKGSSRLLTKGQPDGQEGYSDLQQEYFIFCTDELLSDAVVGDGIISQNDFGDKLVQFCETFTVPSMASSHQCPANRFTSLPVEVQLIFSYAVCPDDEEESVQMECLDSLDSLNGMGAEFGYIVSQETMPQVQVTVENLCIELFPFVFRKFSCILDRIHSMLFLIALFFIQLQNLRVHRPKPSLPPQAHQNHRLSLQLQISPRRMRTRTSCPQTANRPQLAKRIHLTEK